MKFNLTPVFKGGWEGHGLQLRQALFCVILQKTTPPVSLLSWKWVPMSILYLLDILSPPSGCFSVVLSPSPHSYVPLLSTLSHLHSPLETGFASAGCHSSAAFHSSLLSDAPIDLPRHNSNICLSMHAAPQIGVHCIHLFMANLEFAKFFAYSEKSYI